MDHLQESSSMILILYQKPLSLESLLSSIRSSCTTLQETSADNTKEDSESKNYANLASIPFEIITEILSHYRNRHGLCQRSFAAVCLGLTCRRLYTICKPHWVQTKHRKDSEIPIRFTGNACECTEGDWEMDHDDNHGFEFPPVVSMKARGHRLWCGDRLRKPFFALLTQWMGPRYEFIELRSMIGGSFVDINIYGTYTNPNVAMREDLSNRYKCWNSWTMMYGKKRDDTLPTPSNRGADWWKTARDVMLRDAARYYYLDEWVRVWGYDDHNWRWIENGLNDETIFEVVVDDFKFLVFSEGRHWLNF